MNEQLIRNCIEQLKLFANHKFAAHAGSPHPDEYYCRACDHLHSSGGEVLRMLWDLPIITAWMNDGSGHATPVRNIFSRYIHEGANLEQCCDALERTFLRGIPQDATELPKVTGRYSQHVHRGGPTPHLGGLAYA